MLDRVRIVNFSPRSRASQINRDTVPRLAGEMITVKTSIRPA